MPRLPDTPAEQHRPYPAGQWARKETPEDPYGVPLREEPHPGQRESEPGNEDLSEPAKASSAAQAVEESPQHQGGSADSSPQRREPLAATYEALKVVQQLNSSSPELPEEDHLPVADLLELSSGHAETLQSGRQEVLRALEEGGLDSTETDAASRLLPAAKQLLKGLDEFLADEELWGRLKGAEAATAALNDRSRLTLREVCDQDLEAILVNMGYREPPPAQQLQSELKTALEELLEDSPDHAMRAMRTRRAEQNMAIFTHRLRRVIDEADQADLGRDVARDQERESLPERLRAALDTGVRVAAPAVLAAGAVGLVSPSTGEAVQAVGIGAGAIASGRELVRQSVQLSATALLSKYLAREASTANPGEQFKGATRRIDSALLDYVASLGDVAREPTPFKLHLAETLGIESLSAVYGLLQAELDHFPTRHRALHVATRDILGLLRAGQNLLQASDRVDELSRLAHRLDLRHRRLQRIIAVIQD